MNINWYVDEEGTLFVYDGNALINEVSDCADTPEDVLTGIIVDIVTSSMYINNTYSEAIINDFERSFHV